MREMIKMVVVLTLLSSLSGFLLAYAKVATAERIEQQELKFVKGPAIGKILTEASNDPLTDRFKITDGDVERSFYVGILDGATAVAFEAKGKGGYGGDVGIMAAVKLDSDELVGVGVTTHSETAGLGSRAKDDPTFAAQFKGKSAIAPHLVSADGGEINALSGATITSRAVCNGATEAGKIYHRLKSRIAEQAGKFNK